MNKLTIKLLLISGQQGHTGDQLSDFTRAHKSCVEFDGIEFCNDSGSRSPPLQRNVLIGGR